ncbi:MAG: nickel-dependent hydrogenase large subunit [archaeon]|nr:nickel-dependent hydrogenase large subunit [archaeon]MCP8319682.1 nickel-dependent hydrogenase large subunit [archaeon]
MPTFKVDPMSRIEGHLNITCEIEKKPELGNEYFVTESRASATMFRGFEIFLNGRDPRDAILITQRICGVCPNPHAMASTLALDDAFDAIPPPAAILIRNIVDSTYYLYDHLIHFYLLIGPELGVLMGPDRGAPIIPPVLGNEGIKQGIGSHYYECTRVQRKVNEVVALWGGKFPHIASYYPGGVLVEPTLERVADSIATLIYAWEFIALTHIEDIKNLIEANERLKEVTEAVLGARVGLEDIGVGNGNFLCFGMLPQPWNYESDWLDTSRRVNSIIKAGTWKADIGKRPLDENKITEDVKYSFYDVPDGLHPWDGQTIPNRQKPDAYSWTKAPRYDDEVYEVGPLARMLITQGLEWRVPRIHPVTGEDYGDFVYTVKNPKGSVLDRVVARAATVMICANAAFDFLKELIHMGNGVSNINLKPVPKEAQGRGLWEAPRGALSHWIKIRDYKIAHYQAVVPGTWNWSPRDSKDRPGPGEAAIQCGTTWIPTLNVPQIANALYPGWGDTVADALTKLNPKFANLNMEKTEAEEYINATIPLLIVRSFDPCLACGVHLITPKHRTHVFEVSHGLSSFI